MKLYFSVVFRYLLALQILHFNGSDPTWLVDHSVYYLMGASQRISLYFMVYRRGSCLGSLLFTIYASKLFEVVKCHLPDVYADDNQHTYTAYADDNQLYISFKPGSSASELEAVTALQDCILHIKTWMTADKLRLNDDKTELIVIGTRGLRSRFYILCRHYFQD